MLRIKKPSHIVEILDSVGVSSEYTEFGKESNDRCIYFRIMGVDYWIDWSMDACKLHIGHRWGNYFLFRYMRADGHWPLYKTGLELSWEEIEPYTSMLITIDPLPWQNGQG
jgi:hypothetical protein